VQNVLSTSLISKILKIKIHRTMVVPVVLCGCETWSLTFRKERRLRVIENRVLSRILGPKWNEVIENSENCIMSSLMVYTPHSILFGRSNREE
jgi:hypothetical protein